MRLRHLTGYLAVGVILAFAGCEGSAGSPGAPGAAGTEGTAGTAGTDGKDGVGGGTGTIAGTVNNKISTAGVADVEVVLAPVVPDLALKTDADGKYTAVVPVGNYGVTFKLAGYKDLVANASVIAGQTTTLDAVFEPDAPVGTTVEITGTQAPGEKVTIKVTATPFDGSTVSGYAWTQVGGPAATADGAVNADTVAYTLADAAAYKVELLKHLRLLDRVMVLGISPFSLEEGEATKFEVEVTTSTGKFKTTATVMAKLKSAAVSSGLNNVPVGIPVMLHGKTGVTWAWSMTAPTGSAATLSDAATQNPYFTPDVAGKYTIEQTAGGVALEIEAGEWSGSISGIGADGFPDSAGCTTCHNGTIAPDNFADWRKSGHAHIFSNNLDTSTHYGEGCFSCHTVGYNADVKNKGFDDTDDYAAFIAAGTLNKPGDNWKAIVKDQPKTAALGNIQCENCHGPNSTPLHAQAGMTAGRSSISSDVCATCHGEPKRHARFQQWELSKHGDFTLAISRGTDVSCARCHAGQGFLAWLPQLVAGDPGDIKAPITWTADTAQPQTCATCHDPHAVGDKSGEPNTATVRVSGNTPMLPGGFQANGVGRGAICITCHNSRRGVYNDITFDGVTKKIDDRAPHGSAQGDVLMGQNAFFVTIGERSPHSFITDSCANCHLERTDPPPELSYKLGGTNHTFSATAKICADCHADTKVDASALQSAFTAQNDALKKALEGALTSELKLQTAAGNSVKVSGSNAASGGTDLSVTITPATIATVTKIELTEHHGRSSMDITIGAQTVFHVQLAGNTEVTNASAAVIGNLIDNTLAANHGQLISKASWNYWLTHSDGSKGVHNPKFTFGMMEQARIRLLALQP